jgi:hypothetical protein
MQTSAESIRRPLRHALFTLLLCIATLWVMPRSARAQIYVAQDLGGLTPAVGKYNVTGAPINPSFITGFTFLKGPTGLALSGNALYVAYGNGGGSTVGKYDATTGALINANFITGAGGDFLAISGNNLFWGRW